MSVFKYGKLSDFLQQISLSSLSREIVHAAYITTMECKVILPVFLHKNNKSLIIIVTCLSTSIFYLLLINSQSTINHVRHNTIIFL